MAKKPFTKLAAPKTRAKAQDMAADIEEWAGDLETWSSEVAELVDQIISSHGGLADENTEKDEYNNLHAELVSAMEDLQEHFDNVPEWKD